jgi:hypothetical protein
MYRMPELKKTESPDEKRRCGNLIYQGTGDFHTGNIKVDEGINEHYGIPES